MAHTMHIFLQQLDMQHLVLLPYMTIQDQFTEVRNHWWCMTNYAHEVDPLSFFFFSFVGLGGESSRGMGKKIFVGRLPQEATIEDLRQYFGRFGHILDVYIPRVWCHLSLKRKFTVEIINEITLLMPMCNAGPEENWPQRFWFCYFCWRWCSRPCITKISWDLWAAGIKLIFFLSSTMRKL